MSYCLNFQVMILPLTPYLGTAFILGSVDES
jgi:hypothetical protein